MQTKKITSIIIIFDIIVCAIILGINYYFNSGDDPQEEELSTVAIVTTESDSAVFEPAIAVDATTTEKPESHFAINIGLMSIMRSMARIWASKMLSLMRRQLRML